ncbi:hypothetical protein TraAM80_07265 [Trypanosoma rangeli]|uniref:Uncharacterized protein n=1 Tax=Trypanosoma rangeli TaxID=5698 RepID=A0A3R7M7U2_TRYRA|nr:uncharacterized protein TraAM80_07265 [Trypanosoma rangeli]RNF01022.1 hypothetical protein TraAM80_07265 [Trypanosoma rangeli]|eukprot:RNF01022.1 hypothetical protein TraAM80_07265 [Trypanosoma rangeli]
MMLCTAVRCCCYVSLLGVALLLAASVVTRPAVGATMSDTLAASLADGARGGLKLGRYVRDRVVSAVPPAARPHVHHFLAGATSVALVGHGLHSMPGLSGSAAAGSTPWAKSSGITAPLMNFVTIVTAQPVEKLFYALGGILVELLILRLLVSSPRLPLFDGPMRGGKANARRTLMHRLFSTHAGWALLVLCVAVPNGVVEAGLIVVMLTRLPLESYAPALVIGKLAQPYVAAALRELPCVQRLMQTTLWFTAEKEAAALSLLPLHNTVVEVTLWVVVVALVLLFAARFVWAHPATAADEDNGGATDDLMNDNDESNEE